MDKNFKKIKDNSGLIHCIIKNSSKSQPRITSDFLKFNLDEHEAHNNNNKEYPNMAKRCPNINKYKNKMHLLPYYFCKKCKIEICVGCAYKHLHDNDRSNLVTKENILKNKAKILDDLINLYERYTDVFKEEEKKIISDKKNFDELKNIINNKIYDIEEDYTNMLNSVEKMKNWQERNKNFVEQSLKKNVDRSMGYASQNFENFNYCDELNNLEELKNNRNIFKLGIIHNLENFIGKKRQRDEKNKNLLFDILSNMKYKDNKYNFNNDSDSLNDDEFLEAIKIFGLEDLIIKNSINYYCDIFLKKMKSENYKNKENEEENAQNKDYNKEKKLKGINIKLIN